MARKRITTPHTTTLQEVLAFLERDADLLVAALQRTDVPLSQEALQAADHLMRAAARITPAAKVLEARVKESGGVVPCLPGDFRLDVRLDSRRNPSWKDEAVRRAAEAATLRNLPFAPATYIAAVQANTPPSTVHHIRVIGPEG